MTTSEHVEKLSASIKMIADACLKLLAEKPQEKRSGHISFGVGEFVFAAIEELMREIRASDWKLTPNDILGQIEGHSKEIFASLEEIHKFSFEPNSKQEDINTLLNRLENRWHHAYRACVANLPFQRVNTRIATNSEVLMAEYLSKAKEDRKSILEAKEDVNRITSEFETTLAASKDATRLMAVSGQGEFLSSEAVRYQRIGIWWLISAVIIAGVLAGYVITELHHSSNIPQALASISSSTNFSTISTATNAPVLVAPPVTLGSVVANSLPRLIIVSLLFTSLVFVMRNYAAASHNEVINRHRAAALSTFRAFYEAEKGRDETVCKAILLQAAKCIFTVQPSGFLKNEAETPQITQVNETLRNQ
jgi:hypothetical protein